MRQVQLNQTALHAKINHFLYRKTRQYGLKDPLEPMAPRVHTISRQEIINAYRYAPTKTQMMLRLGS